MTVCDQTHLLELENARGKMDWSHHLKEKTGDAEVISGYFPNMDHCDPDILKWHMIKREALPKDVVMLSFFQG